MLGMAAAFAGSMAKFAASGFNRVDEQSHGLRVASATHVRTARRTAARCAAASLPKGLAAPRGLLDREVAGLGGREMKDEG